MFRYGGPIKEGIMDGMKDRTIAGGNQVGTPMGDRTGFADPRKQIFKFLPGVSKVYDRGIANIKNFFSGTAPSTVRIGLGRTRTPTTIERAKSLFKTSPAGQTLLNDPLVKFTTGTGTVATKAIKPLVKGAFTTPSGLLLTGATLTDVLPGGKPFGPDKYLPNILGQRFDPVTGEKIPGTGLFNPGGDKDTPKVEGKFRRKESKDGTTTGGVVENKVEKLDPKQFEERKKYYYSLMGIDKMKKDAAYDSLIDASNIIREEGGDLRGAIKSGSLQNRLINAISKNLDKSTDLKKQIDAAILKGEITKDIEQSKVPESIRTARALGISDKEYKDKILGKDSVATTLSNYMMKQGSLTPEVVAGALKTEGKDPISVIGSDKVKDFKKKFGADKDEIDLLLSAEDLKEGFYVVGKRIIEIDDKGDASFYY
jgi:hypothetical protein